LGVQRWPDEAAAASCVVAGNKEEREERKQKIEERSEPIGQLRKIDLFEGA
jgi:hypothetical protein